MIYTVTLNPSVDITVLVSAINHQDVTRINKTVRDAAGKGVNVSRVVNALGEAVVCLGFVGGTNGAFIRKELDAWDIKHNFVSVMNNTRENYKIVDRSSGEVLELNDPGESVNDSELGSLLDIFYDTVQTNDIVVLSGSVPGTLTKRIYHQLITYCNKQSITTILDTSGEQFDQSVLAGPTIVTPNRYELEQYAGFPLEHDTDIVRATQNLWEYGIKEIIVTLGKEGCIYITKEQVLRVHNPSVTVVSTVGAGDAFVGGYAVAINRGLNPEERLQLATASAMASVETEGTKPGTLETISSYCNKVEVKSIQK